MSNFHTLKYIDLSFLNIEVIDELIIYNQITSAIYIPGKSQTNLKISIGLTRIQSFLRFCCLSNITNNPAID